jgi:hypothetical protein
MEGAIETTLETVLRRFVSTCFDVLDFLTRRRREKHRQELVVKKPGVNVIKLFLQH